MFKCRLFIFLFFCFFGCLWYVCVFVWVCIVCFWYYEFWLLIIYIKDDFCFYGFVKYFLYVMIGWYDILKSCFDYLFWKKNLVLNLYKYLLIWLVINIFLEFFVIFVFFLFIVLYYVVKLCFFYLYCLFFIVLVDFIFSFL